MSKQYDLTGKRFGKLLVINKIGSFKLNNGRSEIRWNCVCDCGNNYVASTTSLNNGSTTQCRECSHLQSGLKRRINLTGQTYGKLTVRKMMYNYNRNKTACECDCECGKTGVIVDAYRLSNGLVKSCGCIKGLSQRKEMTGKKYGRLLVLEEIFEKEPYLVKCLCDCGNEVILRRHDVLTGHTKSCGCINKEILRDLKDVDYTGYISDFGVKIIKKASKNKYNQQLWECECGICGNHFEDIPIRIKNNHVRSCGCLKRSSMEVFIEQILIDNCVNYIPQYTFPDCKSDKNYVLRFDFAVFDSKLNLVFVIEYDGKQHFEPVKLFGGEDRYEDTVRRDDIKNEYCKNNNIKLIRFNYTMEAKTIKEMIENLLLSVTTTGTV